MTSTPGATARAIRVPRIAPALQDAGLAAFFAVVAVVERGAGDALHAGPAWANLVITGTVVLLLALRRAAPVRVLLGTCAVIALPTFLVRHDFLIWSHMVPILIETYTVARYRGPRIALLSLIGVFGLLSVVFTVLMPWDPQALLWCGLFFGVIFVGATLRRSSAVRAALHDASLRIEAGRAERERVLVLRERARLALELQDTVAGAVALMTAQAAAADSLVDADPETAATRIAGLERVGRQAVGDLRRMLGLLRAEQDEPGAVTLPALRTLEGLAPELAGAGWQVDVVGEPRSVPSTFAVTVQRIVQDLLAAAPSTAPGSLDVRYGADLEVVVRPASVTSAPTQAVRERVALLRGDLLARSDGSVTVRLPWPDRS